MNDVRGHAIYPGSFDPPTFGHLDVIARAASVFATVTVAVVVNPQKRKPHFTLDERETMLRRCAEAFPNVIVKGLRVVSDFENEMAFAHMNRSLTGVDTMFLMADSSFSFVSSSLIKEVFLQGGDISKYVPDVVLGYMNNKRHANGRT